jgi:oligopeptide/dipeptide ABC transporter ATP-binding protein
MPDQPFATTAAPPAATSPHLLDVEDLFVEFHTRDGVARVINGVSFHLDPGETLAILGESGSGKSVTAQAIMGILDTPPAVVRSGRIRYRGRDLLTMAEADRRQTRARDIAMVFQDALSALNPVFPVGWQIAETLRTRAGLSRPESRSRAIALMDRVRIPAARSRVDDYPHQFSGGMRQRVMIAIAIACLPKILIADEPTTALDVTIQAQIVELVQRLKDDLGMSIIWITHDLGVVAGMADRVMVMYGGQVAERATVDELYEHPQHPYTLGLLGALPRLDETQSRRLVSIEGSPPDLHIEPSHCQFAYRCPYAFERCWEEIPPLSAIAHRHKLACFYDIQKGKPRNAD